MKRDFWESSHTPVRFPKASFTLTPESRVGFFGSCFASELADRYGELALPCFSSPYGITYNPLTLGESIGNIIDNRFTGEPFYQLNLWRHFSFHSSLCYKGQPEDRDNAVSHFQNLIQKSHKDLAAADFLVITLGTAWVYNHRILSVIVNNCHRCDNRDFERDCFLKWDDSGSGGSLGKSLDRLKEYNEKIRIILTVSPVRHLRNDARENSYSKALLRCLCEDLCRDRNWIDYFPAYEIVMDELRDYRWYAEDLSHPSQQAASYILDRFLAWAGGDELSAYIETREKNLKRSRHKHLS